MGSYILNLFIFCVILVIYKSVNAADSKNSVVSARVESCGGCSLNRLPDVRKFVFEDIPKYDNVEFKKIHGAVPELLLLNEADEEIERISLSKLNRDECNELLINKGFTLKPEYAEKVKEEF